jgi:hypothetical protein
MNEMSGALVVVAIILIVWGDSGLSTLCGTALMLAAALLQFFSGAV